MSDLKSGFFDSSGGDRLYDASDFSRYLEGIISNGCFPGPPGGTGFKVVQNVEGISSDPPSVVVSSGKAYYNGMWVYNDEDYIYPLGDTQPISATTFLLYFCFDTNDDGRIATIECFTIAPSDGNGKYYMPLASIAYTPVKQPVNAYITDMRSSAGATSTSVDTPELVDGAVTTPKIENYAVGLAKLAKTGIFLGEIAATYITAGASPWSPAINTWRNFTAGAVILTAYIPPVDVNLILIGGMNGTHYAANSAVHNLSVGVDVNGAKVSLATCVLGVHDAGSNPNTNVSPFSIPFAKIIQLNAGTAYTLTAGVLATVANQHYNYGYVFGMMMAIPR